MPNENVPVEVKELFADLLEYRKKHGNDALFALADDVALMAQIIKYIDKYGVADSLDKVYYILGVLKKTKQTQP